jgi:hypothetical protein
VALEPLLLFWIEREYFDERVSLPDDSKPNDPDSSRQLKESLNHPCETVRATDWILLSDGWLSGDNKCSDQENSCTGESESPYWTGLFSVRESIKDHTGYTEMVLIVCDRRPFAVPAYSSSRDVGDYKFTRPNIKSDIHG